MALSFPSSVSRRQLHSSPFIRSAALYAFLLCLMLGSSAQMLLSAPVAMPASAAANTATLSFVPNAGQSAPQVRFQSATQDASLFFTDNEVVLALPSARQADTATVLRLNFIGANPSPLIEPSDVLPGRFNALLGNDPSTWHTGLSTYAAISYQQLYPGISMRYEGQAGDLKSTYFVAPGADPTQIRWSYQGAQQLELSKTGSLMLHMPDGRSIVEHAPIAWQEQNGQRIPVNAAFVLEADQSLRFALGAYNPAQALIIDPTLSYSTYLRGVGATTDSATDVAIATEGGLTYAYVTGYTFSASFPSGASASGSIGSLLRSDMYVTKINPSLSGAASHIYTTVIGGDSADSAHAIIAQSDGQVFVAGETSSSNFPMTAAHTLDTTYGGGAMDAVVIGLISDGTSLNFASFFGGAGNDAAYGLDGDATTGLAIAGVSNSATGFPAATNTGYAHTAGDDAFVMLLNGPLTTPDLGYFSFLGGDDSDGARAVAMSNGNMYVTGWTNSFNTNIQRTDTLDKTSGDRDAFVAQIDPTASNSASLVYSRLVGGSGDDEASALRINSNQQAVVVGTTGSNDFVITPGVLKDRKFGGDTDAFVVVLENTAPAPALIAASYLGGSGNEYATDIALASNGTMFVTGATASSGWGISSLQDFGGGSDAFVAKLSPTLSSSLYISYLGGSGADVGYGIAIDSASQVYVAGATDSSPFAPTPTNAGFEMIGGSVAGYSTDGFFAMLVNTAPTLTAATMTVAEGSTTALSVAQLNATDTDDDTAALLFTLTTAPSNGSLTLDPDGAVGLLPAQPLAVNDTFTNAQLLAGDVSYVHNGSETSSDSFAVTVSDSQATSPAASVNITITPVNDPPTIAAQSFDLPENSPNGTLVANVAASDPDSPTLSYSITAGNTGGAFAINATTGAISVANSTLLNYETSPSFALTVAVSDGSLEASNTVTINLTNVNEPPTIAAPSFTLAENSPNSTVVGTVAASDPDVPSTLSYSITAGNSSGAFTLNSTNGTLSVADSTKLDYETTPSFVLTIKVSDGSLEASNSVTVNLTNVNDVAPVITSTSFSVAENSANTTVVGTVAITDPDGATPTFSIISGTGTSVFSIDPLTGKITVTNNTTLDRETNPTFNLDVQVDDGVHQANKLLTINLTDVNDNPPTITAPADFNLDENTANGTLIGTAIVASDPDSADILSFSITAGNTNNAFAIDTSTKQLKVNNSAALDYETNPIFTLTIQVSDGLHTNTDSVEITLNDLNEPPTIAKQSFSIFENSNNNTVVGTLSVSDPENAALTYSFLSGNTNTAFAVDLVTKQLIVNNSAALDYETIKTFTLDIQVSDGTNTAHNTITVNLTDLNDNTPVIGPQSFSIAENSPIATPVGTVTATDADASSMLLYSITAGNTNTAFSINTSTGQLIINNSAAVDYETTPVFNLTVQVSDGVNSASNTVTVTLTNTNDAPVLDPAATLTLSSIAEDTPAASNTGTLVSSILGSSISDQDANALEGMAILGASTANGSWEYSLDGSTWTALGNVSDAAAVLLAADASTRIRFLPAANFNGLVDPAITFRAWDRTSGANGDSNINLAVNGGISAYSSATKTASITVTPVNDPPTAVDDQLSVEQDSSNNALDVLANDSIAPDSGETIQITAVTAATYGTVQINATKDGLIYTPKSDYLGFDSFTYTITDSSGSSATASVRVRVGPYQVMLPLVLGEPLGPDLEITSFSVTPNSSSYVAGQAVQINVTIKNNGTLPASGFWVDLYINPLTVPNSSNIPWEQNCGMFPCYGIAWLVESGLAGGESITLTSTSNSYYADNTYWPGYFAQGTTDLYVYVDSWNGGVPNGAINERNENNNRAEIHALQVKGITPSLSSSPNSMPERRRP